MHTVSRLLLVFGLVRSALPAPGAIADEVIVPARAGWVDSGVDVGTATAGRVLSIHASGQWTNGGVSPIFVGAAGLPNAKTPAAPLPAENLAALIGKVKDSVFLIGDASSVRSPAAGRLYLGINDDPATLDDNRGELSVEVSVNPKPAVNPVSHVNLELVSNSPDPLRAGAPASFTVEVWSERGELEAGRLNASVGALTLHAEQGMEKVPQLPEGVVYRAIFSTGNTPLNAGPAKLEGSVLC